MSVPVPLGQYVPGNSPVHRMDARAKLGVTAVFTVLVFTLSTWAGFGIIGVAVAFAVLASRVPPRAVLRGLKPVLLLLIFTLAANGLRWNSPDPLVHLGPLGIDAVGLSRGVFFGVRILMLVVGTSLVTLTTSPVDLTDALAILMKPLSVVRFPSEDAAMMLSIALRFVPTTAEEAERIVVAQTARGALFDEGGPVRRARAWIPVLIPLFVRLFRRADDLAVAMESRCYSGRGRTRLRQSVMKASDWVILLGALCGAVILGVLL